MSDTKKKKDLIIRVNIPADIYIPTLSNLKKYGILFVTLN